MWSHHYHRHTHQLNPSSILCVGATVPLWATIGWHRVTYYLSRFCYSLLANYYGLVDIIGLASDNGLFSVVRVQWQETLSYCYL
jgi:hypothetical protein